MDAGPQEHALVSLDQEQGLDLLLPRGTVRFDRYHREPARRHHGKVLGGCSERTQGKNMTGISDRLKMEQRWIYVFFTINYTVNFLRKRILGAL